MRSESNPLGREWAWVADPTGDSTDRLDQQAAWAVVLIAMALAGTYVRQLQRLPVKAVHRRRELHHE